MIDFSAGYIYAINLLPYKIKTVSLGTPNVISLAKWTCTNNESDVKPAYQTLPPYSFEVEISLKI